MVRRTATRRTTVVTSGNGNDPSGPTRAELEAALAIDENNMETVARNQPKLFYTAAKRLALAISKKDQLHQRAKEVYAEVYITLRATAENEERKVTEVTLEQLCVDSEAVRDIKRQELEADKQVSLWWALKDAYADRRGALDQLVKLYLANYFGSDMDRGERNLRSADAAIARRAQSDIRAQRRLRE